VTADTVVDDAANKDLQQHPALQGALLAETTNAAGVRVQAVEPGSPAAQVGLRNDDRIVSANGRRVGDRQTLSSIWRATLARGSSTLVLQVRRGDEPIILLLR
jgi:serine protease DegQ